MNWISEAMKFATAYMRGDRLFLHSSSKTIHGLWVLSLPVFSMHHPTPAELGAKVLEALEGSKEGIPNPKTWDGVFDPVLQLAGMKSWNTFVKSTKCVSIEFETNRVLFLPMRNLGAKAGFEPIKARPRDCPPVDAILGRLLLATFDDAV